jgi:hypothetical protein
MLTGIAAKLCAFVFALVLAILLGTMVYSILHPNTSPFRSMLPRVIGNAVRYCYRSLLFGCMIILGFFPTVLSRHSEPGPFEPFKRLANRTYRKVNEHLKSDRASNDTKTVSVWNIAAYNNIMSRTYDDALLDDASSSLRNILNNVDHATDPMHKSAIVGLLEYLLSPRASLRSPLTAATAIADYRTSNNRILILHQG